MSNDTVSAADIGLPHPKNVADLPPRYAMKCVGDCLAPEIPNGAIVIFDQAMPIQVGKFVAIHFTPEVAAKVGLDALVKRLVIDLRHPLSDVLMPTGQRGVIVEQLNPRRRYCIPSTDIAAVHAFDGIKQPQTRTISHRTRPRLKETAARVA